MATQVQYGEITIDNCRTEQFEQEMRYDESNTDLLYHAFTISVSGVLGLETQSGPTGVSVPGADTVAMMQSLQRYMMHPRLDFYYAVGSTVLVQATHNPATAYRDVDNGPKPVACHITHIASNRVFRIRFTIRIALVLCGATYVHNYVSGPVLAPITSDPVLNHRWSLVETKDTNFYTTRMWSGVLRVAHVIYNPNWLRHLVLPQQQKGYRRDNMTWTATPDGLTLKYDITDKQEYQSPPWPATTMKGAYSEQMGQGGRVGTAEVSVELTGPPAASKRDLITRCAEICHDRLHFNEAGSVIFSEPVITGGTIVEYLGENRVSMRMRILRAPKDATTGQELYMNFVLRKIGRPLGIPNYDSKEFPTPGPYDSGTPAGAFVMYMQSPCDHAHGMPYSAPLQDGEPSPGDLYRPTEQPDQEYNLQQQIPEHDQYRHSSGHGEYPYTHVELSSRYIIDRGKHQLAIAIEDVNAESEADETSQRGGGAGDEPDPPIDTDPTAVVVQVHGAIATRIQHMKAERIGQWPTMPAPQDGVDPNNIDETLLSEDILVHNRELMSDGVNWRHQVEVQYVYALSRAPTAMEQLRAGADPSTNANMSEAIYPLDTRVETIDQPQEQ